MRPDAMYCATSSWRCKPTPACADPLANVALGEDRLLAALATDDAGRKRLANTTAANSRNTAEAAAAKGGAR